MTGDGKDNRYFQASLAVANLITKSVAAPSQEYSAHFCAQSSPFRREKAREQGSGQTGILV
jgi:hypothetical protein